ncbi:MAG: hypothetical protein EAZ92_00010 [Candidatus Kapaibacterium sp.]|nr:MAG: hypothetical protein EAZ92_00010 [Candidatus Kapabacteria bacterium]
MKFPPIRLAASIYALCVVFGLIPSGGMLLFAQQKSQRPLLQKPDTVYTSRQIITADTLNTRGDSTIVGTTPPGEYPFTPEQDRAFYEALKMQVDPAMRFHFEAQRFSAMWMAAQELQKLSPRDIALANMAVDPRVLEPTPRDREAYKYGIAQSFTIPGVYEPYKRYGGLPGMGGDGISIPLSLIGSLLGLTEDVSPTIRYIVEQPTEVEIIIYSIQAIAITRILKETQNAGGHSVTWNLTNEAGLRVPNGDYIAEVRIGLQSIVRKRIRLG